MILSGRGTNPHPFDSVVSSDRLTGTPSHPTSMLLRQHQLGHGCVGGRSLACRTAPLCRPSSSSSSSRYAGSLSRQSGLAPQQIQGQRILPSMLQPCRAAFEESLPAPSRAQRASSPGIVSDSGNILDPQVSSCHAAAPSSAHHVAVKLSSSMQQ